jgi:hypothetical protein
VASTLCEANFFTIKHWPLFVFVQSLHVQEEDKKIELKYRNSDASR